jgi:primosomal protein N'
LKKSGEEELTNNNLCKIFEYYSCIQLELVNKKQYYLYEDIDPNFKELNKMSQNDTGIDACDLVDTIVQCKLRKNILSWQECSTFFGSNIIKSNNELQIRWKNMIITRNTCSKLSKNLSDKSDLFTDITYDKKDLLDHCENLLKNQIILQKEVESKIVLRDYQKECINLIKNNGNCIINLPTGTGKNVIIINSLLKDKSYLILVPRITLMEQLHEEILKHKPSLKNHTQLNWKWKIFI